jgi:hypothetical protein
MSFLLDPDRNFLPTKRTIRNQGVVVISSEVLAWAERNVAGLAVFFPEKYTVQHNIIKTPVVEPGVAYAAVPLTRAEVQITLLELNPHVPDEVFDIIFPPGTSVYDEAFDRHFFSLQANNPEELEKRIDEQVSILQQDPLWTKEIVASPLQTSAGTQSQSIPDKSDSRVSSVPSSTSTHISEVGLEWFLYVSIPVACCAAAIVWLIKKNMRHS